MDLKLRPYGPEDEAFVYELKKECYHSYVSALWGWEEADQKRYFQTFIRRAGGQMSVITADGAPIGMLNWAVPSESTFELENLCLKPAWRGQGIGTRILREILQTCGRPAVTLQVFKTNPAIRLYQRLGFQITGESEFHYQMKNDREETTL